MASLRPTKITTDEGFETAVSDKLIRYGGPWAKVQIKSAHGSWLYDPAGKKILDFTSGQMSSVLGHSHPELVEVIKKQCENLMHLNLVMVSDPVLDCATAVTSMLPKGLDKCLFVSTGSETNEVAIKMAKVYTGKFEVIALSAGYHGMTHGSAAATFSYGRHAAGPSVPGTFILPTPYPYRSPFRHPDGTYDWKSELDYGFALIDRQSSGSLACLVIEGIVSTGGILPLPDGYLKAIKEECVKRGMLLIIDEAQTGFGRTGSNFAFEYYGVVPDILTLSKTLGAGLPLGAVVTSTEIERVWHEKRGYYGTTHMNDPLVCAVGAKVVEIIKRDNMAEQSATKGKFMKTAFEKLKEKYSVIGEVRGRGLMIGVEFVQDPVSKVPAENLGQAIAARCMETGLSCNIVQLPGMGGSFRMAPPLTITEDEILEGVQIFDEAIAWCLQRGFNT
ncbi:2,2-dialkylglycine decarboxylase (pyruvate) [Capronia coronata CBS 617.96]|uniref:2,2-dialkylglycine decarboxylase (Pyruvate) n=1 Tax=Capronia coronata CBS 617.96 TaxID=1182541 RepID=W9XPC5_9EURO|nr:2,2-dialkylglycine decarboxylase (pyruvate) [Capronia coronata CBS 617.96]EXJ78826.1 2,2-dialkylglycine decarboxylase (pyruvate) [Capronia coronata CBS 617.96]